VGSRSNEDPAALAFICDARNRWTASKVRARSAFMMLTGLGRVIQRHYAGAAAFGDSIHMNMADLISGML
jgi:hypothetical protein